MKHMENDNIQEKPIIVIEDSDTAYSTQEHLEEPTIVIEHDDDQYPPTAFDRSIAFGSNDGHDDGSGNHGPENKWKPWLKYSAGLIAAVIVVLVCYKAISLYNYYYNIGVSVSVSPKDNIGKLAHMKPQGGASEVTLKNDSVLGVAITIYEPHNAQAELTLEEPDTADRSVLFYTRTADYTATGRYIGSLVVDGKTLQSDASRLGYCAAVDGNIVIGISRSDKMKDYAEEHKGGYFRQFMLVSNGELPRHFFLHGKVERKALARTADDHLCIVETRHPETLWDFADALREYGFVDAIYLTGGNESGFYRYPDGTAAYTEKAAAYRTDKHHGIAPWLVLRRK